MGRARTAGTAILVALTLAATGCGNDAEPRDAATVAVTSDAGVTKESFAASLTALCARLGSASSDDPQVAARAFAAFRDDVARLPQPAADRDAIRTRLVEPLERMVAFTERSAEISGKASPSMEELQSSIAELDKADAEFAVMQAFLREYGVSGCDR